MTEKPRQLPYAHSPYFHVARANDLSGRDRFIYRMLETVPGSLAWGTIFGTIFLSWYAPTYAAYFIIAFDLYWVLKTAYLSMYLRKNWKRLLRNIGINWQERVKSLNYSHIRHLVILPFYNESMEVIERSVRSLAQASGDKSKMLVVIAAEERGGKKRQQQAREILDRYKHVFGETLVTVHPKDIAGEMPGKGSNISYAAEQARVKLLDPNGISYADTIVSAFDIDTVVPEQYFLCLTWHFLTALRPLKSSFQPVPLYNNNIWEAPALSRVVATSGTFWQMIQQERPERLATFSSHSVSFQALYEVGYWQRNMVSEDSRIFWNLFLANNGEYDVIPMSYPVYMDANQGETFWETTKNIYKQQRRWGWGVENVPYVLFSFIKNPRIPKRKKYSVAFVQLEGFWSLVTNPLIIFLLGWLPLILGGIEFHKTILSYNLPIVTRNLMILAMGGLILSAIISFSFLPKPPQYKKSWRSRVWMGLQWLLVPFTIIIFGSLPGLDAQTRLLLGKYMGFWVTPKAARKKS